MSEPVRGFREPVRLAYTVAAGPVLAEFLAGLREGRIEGRRCPACGKVYVPPRGVCPTCGVPPAERVPVADTGTVTSFCVVNVPFEGQAMELPYVYASVLLDGADVELLHLVAGVEASRARMGMRVRAAWRPPGERPATLEAIRCFEPLAVVARDGEPT